jgi:hypothetical protein
MAHPASLYRHWVWSLVWSCLGLGVKLFGAGLGARFEVVWCPFSLFEKTVESDQGWRNLNSPENGPWHRWSGKWLVGPGRGTPSLFFGPMTSLGLLGSSVLLTFILAFPWPPWNIAFPGPLWPFFSLASLAFPGSSLAPLAFLTFHPRTL